MVLILPKIRILFINKLHYFIFYSKKYLIFNILEEWSEILGTDIYINI